MPLTISQERSVSLKKLINGTALIAGTTIGAGMLGIPLVTAQAGFLPAVCSTLCVWIFMAMTGILYVEVALSLPSGANIFSLAGHYLGRSGKIAAGGMFVFLYYCLLIAYISGGAPLLGYLCHAFGLSLDPNASLLLFTVLFGTIVYLGSKVITRVNLILTVAMFFAYALLISKGSSEVMLQQLSTMHWSKMGYALPILFSAFGFHNVVPSLCTYLQRDAKCLKLSILCGTGLALCVYLVWQWLILGSLSEPAIQVALQQGQPVTVALQTLTGKSTLFAIGQSFAFFALVTSFLGVAFSVSDFLRDALKRVVKTSGRGIFILLTFLPPALCAFWNPHLFEKALSIAGGFGEAFLNGLLPVALAWKFQKVKQGGEGLYANKGVLGSLFAFGLFVMGLEAFTLF